MRDPIADFKITEKEAVHLCKKKKELFNDTEFPADASALFRNPDKPWPGHIPAEYVKWLRISEVCPGKPVLFADGAEPGDVIQGALGDCWFLGALSTLALKQDLLQNLFVSSKHAKYGVYTLRFFKNGAWKEFVIDDLIPCNPSGKPLYAHGKDPNETWVMLLEKAYAKLHGSYENLISGTMTYALRDFTGGAPQMLKFTDPDVKALIANGELWNRLKMFHKTKCLMGCAQSTTGTKEMEFKGGILAGHAYGVTDIREIGPHKLLRIRNPWGRKEWTGDWGDEDDEWEKFPDVAKAVGFTPGNDGTFWMAFHDFVKYYNTLYVCRLFPESWEVHCVKSEWKGPTAGGCPAFPTWTKNPMFTLSIERPCVGFVVLSQRDARMEKTGEDWNKYDHPIAFFVVTKSSFEASKGKFNKLEIVGKGLPFRPDRELSLSVSIRLQPEKGPFIIIPTTHKAGQQGPFFLNVYTSDKAKLEGGEPMEPPSVGDGDDSDSDEGEGEDFEPKAAEEPEKDKKLEKLEKGGDEMDEESIIEMCKAKRCKYEDPHFPADASSLFREADKKPSWHMPPERVKWLRPEEFCPEEPKLFVEGVEPGDVIQGALGDCWFLGALSTVATKQEKLQNLFTNAAKYRKDYGVVTLRFYKNGKWKEVVIDDRIPCMNNKPLYARCKDPNEIWVLLVEKAYAKLHHSYEQLVAGSLSYGLKDLTGGVPQVIKLTDRATKQMIETGMLWKKLIQYHKTDSLMGCAMSTKGTKEMEIADGILAGHAYGITDIREVEGHKLLRVRNPWGKKEWTGDWSDDSEMWEKYPKVKKTLGHTSANDGTFWICWKDFQKSYNKIDICRIFPPEWQETRKKGKWIGESAAGCCMFPSWLKNPQFKVKVKKDEVSTVFISLSQKDARMQKNKRWNEYDHPVGFVVVREEDVVKSKNVKMNKMIAMGLPFAMDREISLSSAIQLDGNQGPFLIIPMTHKPKQEGDFILSIYSSKHISVVGGEAVKFDPAKRDDDDDSDDDEEAAKEMDQTTKESSDEDSGAEDDAKPAAKAVAAPSPIRGKGKAGGAIRPVAGNLKKLEEDAVKAVDNAKKQLELAEAMLRSIRAMKSSTGA